jgi:hypothetical protein
MEHHKRNFWKFLAENSALERNLRVSLQIIEVSIIKHRKRVGSWKYLGTLLFQPASKINYSILYRILKNFAIFENYHLNTRM